MVAYERTSDMHPIHPHHLNLLHDDRRRQLEGYAQRRRLLRMLRQPVTTALPPADPSARVPVVFPGGSGETAAVVDRAA
jgi:hypothetical protein